MGKIEKFLGLLRIYKMECKFVDADKREIAAPIKPSPTPYTISEIPHELSDFFRILPWFKEKVNDVYVCPLNDNARMLVINTSTVQDNEGMVYYHVNKNYYKAQALARRRRQRGAKHYIDFNGHVYEFIVGIVTDHGLFQQNEEIFQAQQQFLNNWTNKVRESEIQKLLQSPVDLLSFSSFFRSFLSCTVGVTSQDYIERVIGVYYQLFKNKGSEFIEHACNLLIFLNPKLSLIHLPAFVVRFKKLWYKPEILPYLSENEKLFEIFDDVNSPQDTKTSIIERLYQQKMDLKNEWISHLLVDRSSVKMRGRVRVEPPKQKFVELPSWRRVCKNAQHLTDVEDQDLVYFKDGTDIYGFSIVHMFNLVENHNSLNPYTGQPLNRNAVKRFLDTYVRPVEHSEPSKVDAGNLIVDADNELVRLLETQLCLFEKLCMHCRKKKSVDTIFIETYDSNTPILNFCSSECMSKYSVDEFKAIALEN